MAKYCITCHENGHTYLECPRVSFGALVAGAFGVPTLFGQTPEEALRELQQIETERAQRKGEPR